MLFCQLVFLVWMQKLSLASVRLKFQFHPVSNKYFWKSCQREERTLEKNEVEMFGMSNETKGIYSLEQWFSNWGPTAVSGEPQIGRGFLINYPIELHLIGHLRR